MHPGRKHIVASNNANNPDTVKEKISFLEDVQEPTKEVPLERSGLVFGAHVVQNEDELLVAQNADFVQGEEEQKTSFSLKSWNDLPEAKRLLGFEVKRSQREPWASRLAEKNRTFVLKARDETETLAILGGAALCWPEGPPRPPQRCVRYLLSSTFTDTAEERNFFIADVVPFLEEYARVRRIEHTMVEMRWGIRQEDSDQHQTVKICLQELIRCQKESAGITYVLLACQKYGFTPIPAVIEENEFQKLLEACKVDLSPSCKTRNSTEAAALLEKYFSLDYNSAPRAVQCDTAAIDATSCKTPKAREYVLAGNIHWNDYKALQEALRAAARRVWPADCAKLLDTNHASEARKYFTSVTEMEVEQGLLQEREEDRDEKTYVFFRSLQGLQSKEGPAEGQELADSFVDMSEGGVNGEAQELLQAQHNLVRAIASLERQSTYTLEWGPGINVRLPEHRAYMKSYLDRFCEVIADSIDKVSAKAQIEEDSVADEASQHLLFAHRRINIFYETSSTKRVTDVVEQYLASSLPAGGPQKVVVLWARSGGGKTCLMAKAVQLAVERGVLAGGTPAAVVVRFLGTSPDSHRVHQLLVSLVAQLYRLYGVTTSQPSQDWLVLGAQFKKAVLELPTPQRPLVLVLDSLDQLDNSDGGCELEWLVPVLKALPGHVKVVLSTLPDIASSGIRCLSILQESLGSAHALLLEVEPLDDSLGFFSHLLSKTSSRSVTDEQLAVVRNALQAQTEGTTPLWLTVAAQTAEEWKSFDPVSRLEPTVPGIIAQLMQRLEQRHGECLVAATLSYISLAKNGMSATELSQLLNCADAVLADVFQWWLPPLCILPPLLLQRLLYDFTHYVTQRGDDSGQLLLTLYHRQFFVAVDDRYVRKNTTQDRTRERSMELADFFSGKWAGDVEKPFSPALLERARQMAGAAHVQIGTGGQRHVMSQPLTLRRHLIEGKRCVVNARRVNELVSHQLRAGDAYVLQALEQSLCSIDYVAAKMAVRDAPGLLAEYTRAMQLLAAQSSRNGEQLAEMEAAKQSLERVIEGRSFVGRRLELLQSAPCASTIYQLALAEPDDSVMCKSARASLSTDPEQQGFSRFMFKRLWPSKSPYHDACRLRIRDHSLAVNSALFFPDSSKVVSASHDLTIKILDALSGEVVTTMKGHTKAVRALAFCAQFDIIASVSNDKLMKVWSAHGQLLQTLPGHTGDVRCCAFSAAGGRLASSSNDKTIRVYVPVNGRNGREWQLECELKEHKNNVTGIAFSNLRVGAGRDSARLASCSGDTSVLIWDLTTMTVQHRLHSHKRGLTSVAFHPRDAVLASAAWDNLVKLWCVASGTLIATLPPHTSNVMSIAWSPDGRSFLSSVGENLNPTVLIWSLDEPRAVCAGEEAGSVLDVEGDAIRRGNAGGWKCGARDAIKSMQAVLKPMTETMQKGSARVAETLGLTRCRLWLPSLVSYRRVDEPSDRVACESRAAQVLDRIVDGAAQGNASEGKAAAPACTVELKLEQVMLGHTKGVTSVAFNEAGSAIVSASSDCSVMLWDLATAHRNAEDQKKRAAAPSGAQRHASSVACVEFAPGGKVMATCDGPPNALQWSEIRVWEVSSGTELRALQGHRQGISALAFHPARPWLASGSWDGTVGLWDWEEGGELYRLAFHDHVLAVRFSGAAAEDGRGLGGAAGLLLCASGTGLYAHRATDGVRVWEEEAVSERKITTLSVSACGTLVACGARDGAVRLLRQGGRGPERQEQRPCLSVVATLQLPRPPGVTAVAHVLSVTFSPDGALLATVTGDAFAHTASVQLWEVQSKRRVLALSGRYVCFARPDQHAAPQRQVLLVLAEEALVLLLLVDADPDRPHSCCLQSFLLPQRASSLATAGHHVVVGCSDGQVVCLEAGALASASKDALGPTRLPGRLVRS